MSDSAVHDVKCKGCGTTGYSGVRYKCAECYDYDLCHQCASKEITTGKHENNHSMLQIQPPSWSWSSRTFRDKLEFWEPYISFRNRDGWLEGTIPLELTKFTKLCCLCVHDNRLTGPIPPEISRLSRLQEINFSCNKLSGQIPPEISSLSKLTCLKLNDNQFTGPVPPEIANLEKLSILHLENNQLTGPIPPGITNLTRLTRLYLNDNQFSESIPPGLSNCTKLLKLYLGNNKLTGSIPPEIGTLPKLSLLYLNNNQFTGTIPPLLTKLKKLTKFSIKDNYLEGPLPKLQLSKRNFMTEKYNKPISELLQSDTGSESSNSDSQSSSTDSQSSSTDAHSSSTDSQSPITDSQSSITDSRSPITDSQSLITESQSPITDSRSSITDSQSLITESQSPITDSQSSITDSQSSVVEKLHSKPKIHPGLSGIPHSHSNPNIQSTRSVEEESPNVEKQPKLSGLSCPVSPGSPDFSMRSSGHLESILKQSASVSSTRTMLEGVLIDQSKVIGQGAFGEIFKGEYSGVEIAAKRLKEIRPEAIEELIREANSMAEVHHPNVVIFYGLWKDESEMLYMITEWMDHGSLLSFLDKENDRMMYGEPRETTNKDLLMIGLDVARAMKRLSDLKMFHSDLAARNVLLTRNSQRLVGKVTDFGLTQVGSAEDDYFYTESATKVPISWSAPEVLTRRKFSSFSDVWSFGVLLWEIFSLGEMPYRGVFSTQQEQRNAIIKGDYVLEKPDLCPDPVYELMLQCWKLQPSKRITFQQLESGLSAELSK